MNCVQKRKEVDIEMLAPGIGGEIWRVQSAEGVENTCIKYNSIKMLVCLDCQVYCLSCSCFICSNHDGDNINSRCEIDVTKFAYTSASMVRRVSGYLEFSSFSSDVLVLDTDTTVALKVSNNILATSRPIPLSPMFETKYLLSKGENT